MDIKEKGTLPIGVEFGGRLCTEFEIRPGKMKDSIEARASEDLARLMENEEHMGAFLIGKRLTIHGVPPEAMTLDFMLDMFEDDINEVMRTDKRLVNTTRRFRETHLAKTQSDSGLDEDGVQGGKGLDDVGGGSRSLSGQLSGDQEPAAGGEEVQGQTEEEKEEVGSGRESP